MSVPSTRGRQKIHVRQIIPGSNIVETSSSYKTTEFQRRIVKRRTRIFRELGQR
jgi:hypothetical protein